MPIIDQMVREETNERFQDISPIAGGSGAAGGLRAELCQSGVRTSVLRPPLGGSLRLRPLLLRRLARQLPQVESGSDLRVRRPLLPQSPSGLTARPGVPQSQWVLSSAPGPRLGPSRSALR